jgi:hypothetical protein
MRPGEIEEYLQGVLARLATLGGEFTQDPEIVLDPSRSLGQLRSRQTFQDGSSLSVSLTVVGPSSFPDWLDYRFHFMDYDSRCIFRYDNTHHHELGPHFPHHKHVGPSETAEDVVRPSVAEIVYEVARHLGLSQP